MVGFDSVGTLLADIANLLSDGLRILSLADKRHWGPDEHEQLRALEQALDEAKKDFQELAPLVNGQSYYQRDRKRAYFFPSTPSNPSVSSGRPATSCCGLSSQLLVSGRLISSLAS